MDKKRTTQLLQSVGLQCPTGVPQSDYIGSITYKGRSVNIQGVPFQQLATGNKSGKFYAEKQIRKANQAVKYSVAKRDTAAYAEDVNAQQDLAAQLNTANKRIKALEGVNKYLREQMQLTPEHKADPKTLRKAAKNLMAEYGGSWSQQEMEAKLQDAERRNNILTRENARLRKQMRSIAQELREKYGKGVKLGYLQEQLAQIQQTWQEKGAKAAYDQIEDLSVELLQSYILKNSEEAQTVQQIRKQLRGQWIHLAPEYRADLDSEGGYEYLRRHNMGRVLLVNQGTGVDQVYQELSEQYPSYFPESIMNPADQLLQILRVLEDGNQTLLANPKNPVMVDIEFAGQTNYNEVRIYSNFVTTGYGRKESAILTEIEDALNSGRVLQANKKRSQSTSRENRAPSGLWPQCPERLWSSDFKDNIQRFQQDVKRLAPKENRFEKPIRR